MSGSVASGLIPARFMTLVAHLVLTIMMFWTKEENILACLPESYVPSSDLKPSYDSFDTQITIALSLSLVLYVFELFGFLSGISMFMYFQDLFSFCCHSGGAVAMSFMVWDEWCSTDFWYVFGFTAVFPAITEAVTFIVVIMCRKGPF